MTFSLPTQCFAVPRTQAISVIPTSTIAHLHMTTQLTPHNSMPEWSLAWRIQYTYTLLPLRLFFPLALTQPPPPTLSPLQPMPTHPLATSRPPRRLVWRLSAACAAGRSCHPTPQYGARTARPTTLNGFAEVAITCLRWTPGFAMGAGKL